MNYLLKRKKVRILDEKGHAVMLTMIGENTAIDEEGNVWAHNSPWKKQSKPSENQSLEEKPQPVGNHGFGREHNIFDSYKNSHEEKAQEKLIEILGGKNIYNFND